MRELTQDWCEHPDSVANSHWNVRWNPIPEATEPRFVAVLSRVTDD